MEAITLPLIGNMKASDFPDPVEYQYWADRQNRTFYIDYELEDSYEMVELSKTIFQMNIDEKDIPENELKPIYLMIFSYGGDLAQGEYMADLVQSSRIPIYTVAMGAAMSAGFLIFIAGKRRFCFKHSSLLVHAGSGAFQGTASEIDEAQKNYKRTREQMKDFILENTKIDPKEFNKNRNKDWYLTADECLERCICDVIVSNITDIIG